MIHYEIWKIWIRIKNHNRDGSEEGQIFGENEDEQVNYSCFINFLKGYA